ncbi:MAG: YceI family protein [Saprospiraceae bacterium]|nr:YceI family protein [Saprospiraceae bacterium]
MIQHLCNQKFLFPLVCLGCFALVSGGLNAQELFKTGKSQVYFKSDAPLELIEATSGELKGVINMEDRSFAFSIPVRSFQGFNSPLQREHFNENYLESADYPNATFVGKVIEKVDLTQPGEYIVRAKGQLTIHGVEQERIIRSKVVSSNGRLTVTSFFTVLLAEHQITIPKIVYQKIAEVIQVHIEAEFAAEAN